MLYFSKSLRSRRVPTVPAHSPMVEISHHSYQPPPRDNVLTSANIASAVFAAIGAQPSRHGVNVNAITVRSSAEERRSGRFVHH
jgi:hypothetical protein